MPSISWETIILTKGPWRIGDKAHRNFFHILCRKESLETLSKQGIVAQGPL
jgi:hypothetical protein